MSRLTQHLQQLLHRFGVDVRRYYPLAGLLRDLRIDLVIDAGANVGQFGQKLRADGYERKIVSFEPSPESFKQVQSAAGADPLWESMRIALGETEGEQVLHLSRESVFDSLLPPSRDSHFTSKQTQIGEENVAVRRLDRIIHEFCAPTDRVFLKIDTQGSDEAVLRGATGALNQIFALQMEISLSPLYEQQPPIESTIVLAKQLGFELWSLERGATARESGRVLEADAVFVKRA